MAEKKRLDVLVYERGYASSREEAQKIIMTGRVMVNGRLSDKAGVRVPADAEIVVTEPFPYVSRGALKLESAADQLGIEFEDKVVLDVGASTGGFTDYALQHGALKVYAVDVGRGQLDQKLRSDRRVVGMEQTDIRKAKLPQNVDLALVDVSFISLRSVLPHVAKHVKPGGFIIAMAKPQFEAGKETADRFKGVISDGRVREQILARLKDWLAEHFEITGEADSGVPGAKGNVERFYMLRHPGP